MGDEVVGLKVAIRVRPLKATEGRCAWRYDCGDGTVVLQDGDGEDVLDNKSNFRYDAVFGEQSATAEVYDAVVRELVDGVLKGINGTVFAYGQTAAGKTYTMQGGGATDSGVMAMAAEQIFGVLAATADTEFLLRCTYLEVYNETLRDLLGDGDVHIREDARRGVFVEGATEENVMNVEGVMSLLARGEKARHVGATAMNDHSSRSHTVFRIVVESKGATDDGVKIGALSLVDLAGSEKAKLTHATGERLKEGAKINQSLLTLSLVVKQLGENCKAAATKKHVPYRDSKLTRLLQPTLGGDARLAMICCVTLAECFVEETRSTLQFGARAATVTLAPKIHEVLDDASQLRQVKRQLAELQKKQREYDELGQSGKTEELSKLIDMNALLEEAVEGKASQLEMQRVKMEKLAHMIVLGGGGVGASGDRKHITNRGGTRGKTKRARETWAPGAAGMKQEILPFCFGLGVKDNSGEAPLGVLAEEQTIENRSSTALFASASSSPRLPQAVVSSPAVAAETDTASLAELAELRDALDEKNAQLDEKNAQLDENYAQLDEKNAQLDENNAQMDEKNALLDEKNALLQSTRSELETERSRAEYQQRCLWDCLTKLSAEGEAVKDEQAKRGVHCDLEEDRPPSSAERPVEELIGEACDVLSQRRRNWSEALDAATTGQSDAQREAYCFKQEVLELRESYDRFEAQSAELEEELEKARAAAAKATLEANAAEELLSISNKKHAETSDESSSAAALEITELREVVASQKMDLASKDARVERLEAVKMTTDIFRKIQQMQLEKARTEGENTELREQLRCLETELSAENLPSNNAESETTQNNSPLRAAAAALSKGRSSSSSSNALSAGASVAARLQLDELAARNAELSEQLDEARASLKEADSNLEALSDQLTTMGAPPRDGEGLLVLPRLSALARDTAAQIRGLEERLESSTADCARLEDKLRAANARATEHKRGGAHQTPSGRRAQQDLASLQEKIEFLERENLTLMLEIKEVQKGAAAQAKQMTKPPTPTTNTLIHHQTDDTTTTTQGNSAHKKGKHTEDLSCFAKENLFNGQDSSNTLTAADANEPPPECNQS